jgi:GNAT superfamily N-acetyltransferase
MNITKATSTDIPEIMELIRAAVKAMHDQGIYQWNDQYPNPEIITDDVNAGTLYKISDENTIGTDGIGGIIVLNQQFFPEYYDLEWEDKAGKFLIIHRLCIRPDRQRKGLAKKLMRLAESYAEENGYTSIRLDTFTANKAALALYDGLGYRRAGTVTFTMGLFQVFEKVFR